MEQCQYSYSVFHGMRWHLIGPPCCIIIEDEAKADIAICLQSTTRTPFYLSLFLCVSLYQIQTYTHTHKLPPSPTGHVSDVEGSIQFVT